MNDLVGWVSLGVTVLLAVGGAFWWAVQTLIDNRHLRKEREELRSRLREYGDMAELLQSVRTELGRTRIERDVLADKARQLARAYRSLEKRRRQARAQLAGLSEQRDRWAGAAREGARRVVAAEAERDQIRAQLADFERRNVEFSARIQELERQVDGLAASDVALWQRPIAASGPRFRPFGERRFPVISVLNLKGGVGKTTVTAHLAGLFGRQGKQVLAVDLDFQRSLSQMLLTAERRKILHLERRCVQHFLAGRLHGFAELQACAEPVGPAMPGCRLIANSDPAQAGEGQESLELVEARLLSEWVSRRGTPDVRLLLREALHAPEATGQFDYVLFDCPPKLTPACINALAASDFVLIPVILDGLTARAVPHLLAALKRLRADLLPRLSVLGVVANLVTVRLGRPILAEQDVRDDLLRKLGAVWGTDVAFFRTPIPNKSEFAAAARSLEQGELNLALSDPAIAKTFAGLAAEIEEEIRKHERRDAAAVSS